MPAAAGVARSGLAPAPVAAIRSTGSLMRNCSARPPLAMTSVCDGKRVCPIHGTKWAAASTPLNPSKTAMKKAVLMIVPYARSREYRGQPLAARLTDSQNADLKRPRWDGESYGRQIVAEVLLEQRRLRAFHGRGLGQRPGRGLV